MLPSAYNFHSWMLVHFNHLCLQVLPFPALDAGPLQSSIPPSATISTVTNITVGHRTKTGHKCYVTEQILPQSIKMAGQKRPSERTLQQALSSSSSTAITKKSKRQITVSTFEKWQQNYDSEHQSLSWLKCETNKADKNLVARLYCSACREYQTKICSMKNYSAVWVNGSDNQYTSNLLDHATSGQHKKAMAELHTAQARASRTPVVQYAPIAHALSMLSDVDRTRIRKKFNVCYLMAKEGIAFEKFVPLCELESRHGVELGHAYRTAPSASLFTHYIAQSQRQQFLKSLCENNFYSFLMDGSTDAGNVEQELVVILTCMKDDAAEEMKSCTRFLSLESPEKANASGLVKCLSQSLAPLGITDILDENMLSAEGEPVLVGGGTDGASVNVAEHNGMKGMMLSSHPWLVWSWCHAHVLSWLPRMPSPAIFLSVLMRCCYVCSTFTKSHRRRQGN